MAIEALQREQARQGALLDAMWQLLSHGRDPAPRRLRDQDDEAVIVAVAATLTRLAVALDYAGPTLRFAACEILEHARLDADLRATLVRADATNARALAKVLRRCEGQALGGYVLARVKTSNRGIVWCLSVSVS